MPIIAPTVILLSKKEYEKFLNKDPSLYQDILDALQKVSSWDTKVQYKSYQRKKVLDTNLLSVAIILKQNKEVIEKLCDGLSQRQIIEAFKLAVEEDADKTIIDLFLERYPQLASLQYIQDHARSLVKINSYYTEKLLEPYQTDSLKVKSLKPDELINILELALFIKNKKLAKSILDALKNSANASEPKKYFQFLLNKAVNLGHWAALRYIIENNKNYYNEYAFQPEDVSDLLAGADFKYKFVLSLIYHRNISLVSKSIVGAYYSKLEHHLPPNIPLIELFEANFETLNLTEKMPSQGLLLLNYLYNNKEKIAELSQVKAFKQMVFESLETGFMYYQMENHQLVGSKQERMSVIERYGLISSILVGSNENLHQFFTTHRHSFADKTKDTNHIQKLKALRTELSTSVEFLQTILEKTEKTDLGELLYLFLTTKVTDEDLGLPKDYLFHLAQKPEYKKALWDYIEKNKEILKPQLLVFNKDHPINQFFATHRNRHSWFKATDSSKKMADLYQQLNNQSQIVKP